MRHRLLMSIGILAVVLAPLVVAPFPAPGQATSPAAKTWTPPRTPDGQPDLQGLWTMSTFTPLERPRHLAEKEFYTEEEAAELRKLFTADGVDPLAGSVINEKDEEKRSKKLLQSKESIHYDNSIWLRTKQPKGLSSRRTSLIVDPPDGRIPPLTPDAKKRAAARKAARGFDSYENRSLTERCIAWPHEGPPMLPPPYNDILQIFQAPGYVAILPEMSNHGVRIIPLDGRPHISPNIRQIPGTRVAAGKARRLSSTPRISPARRTSEGPARPCMWSNASRAPAPIRSATNSRSKIRRLGRNPGAPRCQ